MTIEVRRLAHAVGAEVSGIDLRQPLDEERFRAIHQAFLEHSVLVFRGQKLGREQQVAFARWFGKPDINEGKRPGRVPPDFKEIFLVVSQPRPDGGPATGRHIGAEWHIDQSHLPATTAIAILRAVAIPDIGGDTQFASLYHAYDTLSDGMKKLIEGLHGVHMVSTAVIDHSTPEREAESRRLYPAAAHALVRTHPESGRKALCISEEVRLIEGMTLEESRPLIDFLMRHALRPEGIYRHVWQEDDLIMWDNRCLLHIALADFDRTRLRHMERTTISAAPSGRPYHGPLQ